MSISDKEFFQLSISINKALNLMDAPLKIKHARSIIITTHRTKEAKSFWAIVVRQPLMENRFTAWKFCHLLHKVLREGHESSLKHSLTHRKMILEMGKLWGHLQDGVGHCIQVYSKLIVTKIDFHQKNSIFPGNLLLEFREIEKFAGNDINIYFQLCVELFDYLDDIIDVQSNVFASINTYRMSSMTPQGQCRLAPLITLIQDSNPLYDITVRIMFKLHDELPNDILIGHRDRFRDMFNKLKFFYDNVRPLQYFADLIQVPHLPESAPNFTSKVDFGSYIPPVVVVPIEPEASPIVENLVDMNVANEQQAIPNDYTEKILEYESILSEKNEFIRHLQTQLTETQSITNSMHSSHHQDMRKLKDEISLLKSELTDAKEMATNMKFLNEDLEFKLQETPTLMQKVSEEEGRAKASEEKFQKLKNMYSQIRDEHINLLRQHGEVTKTLSKLKNENTELSSEKEMLNLEVDKYKAVVSSNEEQLHSKALDSKREIQKNLNEYEKLNICFEALKQTHDNFQSTKCEEIIKLNQKQQETTTNLNKVTNENLELTSQMEMLKLQLEDYEIKSKSKEEQLHRNSFSSEQKIKEISSDYDKLNENFIELKKQHELFKSCKFEEIKKLNDENIKLLVETNNFNDCKLKLVALEKSFKETEEKHNQIKSEQENLIAKLATDLDSKRKEAEQMEQLHKQTLETKIMELDIAQKDIIKTQLLIKENDSTVERLGLEKVSIENELQDMLQQIAAYELKISEYSKVVEAVQLKLSEKKLKYNSLIHSMMHALIKTVELSFKKMNEHELQCFENILKQNEYLKTTLDELCIVYKMYMADDSVVEGFIRKAILVGQHFLILKQNCILIYSSSENIEKGQEVLSKMNSLCAPFENLFENMNRPVSIESVEEHVTTIKTTLDELSGLVTVLQQSSDVSVDLGDLVENELSEMDKAIEEAANRIVEMMSSARSLDSGIKLEVNEKILDACTSLMECIKLLIQKSKILQAEIVAMGRGSASVKEFYKRNSQWTEGLISASKSVARGANMLVEAANKSVSGEANNSLAIIVAAQEIAACTAQLVVASKVKAPLQSQKLLELTKASRSVSQATGAVVATVKDCNQQLELAQEVDFTKLTANQVKTMEMDMHVKVLELEQALQVERLRLSAFRRQNYQNAED